MMRIGRMIFGVGAVLFLVLALNILFWSQDIFSLQVLAPMGVGVLLGVAWLITVVLSLADGFTLEGRTIGGMNAVVSSVIFLGICVVAYLFAQSWTRSWDLTQEGRRELSPQTVQVLRNVTQPVNITCFFLQVDDELVAIAKEKTLRFLDQCKQYSSQLRVELLDPTVARARMESMGITHASTLGTVVIGVGNKQKVITLAGGSPRLDERDFTNALINVLRDTSPKIYFLTGHKERDIIDEDKERGGSMLGNLLRGEAYDVERLGIKLTEPEIPADCDVLVINNVASDLHPLEIETLDKYMDAGGRLVVLMDPWRSITPGYSDKEQLRPWLEKKFGVIVGSDIVVTDKSSNIWQAELRPDNKPFEGIDEGMMDYVGSFFKNSPITENFDQPMLLQAIRSVRPAQNLPDDRICVTLLRTTPDFWGETDTEKLLKAGQAKFDDGVDLKGPVSLAVMAIRRVDKTTNPKGRGDARLVVVGDSDFLSNSQISVPGHLNFFLNTMAWMTESEDLIALRPTGKEFTPLVLSDGQRRALAWMAVALLPQLVLLAGLAVWMMRRKYQ